MSEVPVVAAKELHLSFGATTALSGASIAVEPGELVAVMGSSGSGKSSLLHCLAGLLAPDRGDVSFQGQAMRGLDDKANSALRMKKMGMVFQFGELVPELSLLENVALPLWLLSGDRQRADKAAQELLERFDIIDHRTHRPSEVSGGQLQRAAVARALVHSPEIVFADEPTGALDSTNAQLVMEALIGRAREQGTAVVMVTHESRLASYCDRDVIVADGQTVADAQSTP